MTTTFYTQRVLVADEGKYLTQSAEVALMDRITARKVYLAANSSESVWREITAEEAAEYSRLQGEESERLRKKHEQDNSE